MMLPCELKAPLFERPDRIGDVVRMWKGEKQRGGPWTARTVPGR